MIDLDELFKKAVAEYANMVEYDKVRTKDDLIEALSMTVETARQRQTPIPTTEIGLPNVLSDGSIELVLTTVSTFHNAERQIDMILAEDDLYIKCVGLCLVDDKARYNKTYADFQTHLAVGAILGWRYIVMQELSHALATKMVTLKTTAKQPTCINITTFIDAIEESADKRKAIVDLFASPVTGVAWIEHSLVDESCFVGGDDLPYGERQYNELRYEGADIFTRKYSTQRALGCSFDGFLKEMDNLNARRSDNLKEFIVSNFAIALPRKCIIIPSLSDIIEQVEGDAVITCGEYITPLAVLRRILEVEVPHIGATPNKYDVTYDIIKAKRIPTYQFRLEWNKEQPSTERLYLDVYGEDCGDVGDPELASICTPEEYISLAANPKPDLQIRAPGRLRRYQSLLTRAASMYQEVLCSWCGDGVDTSYKFEEALAMALLIEMYPSTYEVPIPFRNVSDCAVFVAQSYEPMGPYEDEVDNGPPREN